MTIRSYSSSISKMVSVQTFKILILVGLLLFTLILGMLPLLIIKYLKKRSASGVSFHSHLRYKRALSILSCFAAGVFLGTCLLDLLPDVREDLGKALTAMKIPLGFPLAEFVMVFGLFMVLIIEQIVLSVKERKYLKKIKMKLPDSDPHHGSQEPLLGDEEIDNDHLHRRDIHTYSHYQSNEFTRSISSEHSLSGISDHPHAHNATGTTGRHLGHDLNYTEDLPDSPDPHHQQHYRDYELDEEDDHHQSTLRSILLTLAISLHSLFEGLAIGLQNSVGDVLSIFVALLLHKGILSFSLGMSLVQSKLSDWAIVRSLAIFCLSAPLGIGLGIGIIDLWDSELSSLVQGILQGIACGTFLYITFFEVLPHEFNSCDIRLVKVVFLIIGFATVTVTVLV